MNVDIEKYLSEEEIKQACIEAVKEHAIKQFGINKTAIANQMAHQIVKLEHQSYIKDNSHLIEEKILIAINKITLGSLFFTAFGWANEGHKILSGLLIKHKDLLEKKLMKVIS